jgi:hypothetical protein
MMVMVFPSSITASNVMLPAYADKGGTPNDHSSDVAKSPGATDNKEELDACRDSGRSAPECAHDPLQVGKFIHNWAHSINKK